MSYQDPYLWLSHSKINAYLECPFYFKQCYIDKVPIDTKGKYPTALGNGIHKVLEELYKNKDFSLDYIERQWDIVCKEGYFDKNQVFVDPLLTDPKYHYPKGEEETRMLYNHGKKLLREFFHKNKHTFGNNILLATEFNFKIPINKGKIMLNGYIDKIEKTTDGKIIITDYKTGSEKDQQGVDDDFQLSMYTFAIAKNENYQGEEIEACIYYIKSGKVVYSKRNSKDIEKLRKIIIDVKDGIEKKQYEPKKGKQCQYCLYDCPLGINKKEREKYLEEKENINI